MKKKAVLKVVLPIVAIMIIIGLEIWASRFNIPIDICYWVVCLLLTFFVILLAHIYSNNKNKLKEVMQKIGITNRINKFKELVCKLNDNFI